MDEKKNQKKKVMILVLVLGLVLLTIGGTYAFFTYTRQGQQENVLTTGRLYFVYDELSDDPSNIVNIQNAFPMTTEDGKVQEKPGMFEFEVRATTQGSPIYYEIYLTKKDDSTLAEKVVDTYLSSVPTKGGEIETETGITNKWTKQDVNIYNKLWLSQVPPVLDQELDGKTLEQDKVNENEENFTKIYRYRMWIDESANEIDENGSWVYGGKTFTVNVNVYASNEELPSPLEPPVLPFYIDKSNANAPQLAQGMIPVVYNEEETSWMVQDLDKSYDYSTQHWANAVTIDPDYRSQYESADPGTKIDESHINTMWVWIPRYEYDTTNLGYSYAGGSQATPGEIKVQFIEGTGTVSGENYKVHPAFKFGEKELEGFWYGKFETSPETSCSNKATCNVDTIKPQIKPNVASWRYIQVAKAFTVSQKMVTDFKEEYGFSGTEDTHMSKNSEWGAVAYLSQSSYGKYGNDNYKGAEREVYINNCSSYTTGIAGDTASASEDSVCANTYETENGQKASTTGNITGVYDMSGGAEEYVMGVLADGNGQPRSGNSATYNSGFNGTCNSGDCSNVGIAFPSDSKYYDLYKTTDATTACEEGICYGHALSETSGWYNDYNSFVSASLPWFSRGGHYNYASDAGVFYFNNDTGNSFVNYSFRLVLVP